MKSAARFDLADLRLFTAIVDAGSITKGAAAAHLALGSASERLQRIEEEAGVPLLKRKARGISTTEAGEALLHHAHAILQQHALLRREIQDFASGARGTLHLYATTAALTEYLPARLAPWLGQRPELHLELKERTSVEIVRTVAHGHAEAGIASDAVDSMGLMQMRLFQDDLVLICHPGHRLAAREQIAFEDALGETFIGLSEGNALQDLIDGQALAAGRRLDARVRMKSFEGLGEMVSHRVGVCVIPLHAARRLQDRFDFRVLRLQDAWATRWLCACYRDWDDLSMPMRSLLRHLQSSPSVLGDDV